MTEDYLAFAGDWHGNLGWAKKALKCVAEKGVKRLYHAGDFGLWTDYKTDPFFFEIQDFLEEHDMEIWVTPGNHEWWPELNRLFASDPGNIVSTSDRIDRIKWIPRGFQWEDRGVIFLSLGGAPSIDRKYRKEGTSWWPEEAITQEDVDNLKTKRADIMITHDSPNPGTLAVQNIVAKPSPWPVRDVIYADKGRELLTVAVSHVRPRLVVHGHYHTFATKTDADDATTASILSLAMDGSSAGNIICIEVSDFMENSEFMFDVPNVGRF